jgi:lysozyme
MSNWPPDETFFPVCAPLIKQWEGLRLAPYLDSVGVATIGWGTIRYPNGKSVTMADPPITEEYAEECLRFEMKQKSLGIAPRLTRLPTAHQAGAMLSLTYNIGLGAFLSSTVLRKFNEGDTQAAADAFLMWDKGRKDGQLVVIPGLLNRRKAEREFFLTPDA